VVASNGRSSTQAAPRSAPLQPAKWASSLSVSWVRAPSVRRSSVWASLGRAIGESSPSGLPISQLQSSQRQSSQRQSSQLAASLRVGAKRGCATQSFSVGSCPVWSRPLWSRPVWSRPLWSRPLWSRPVGSRPVWQSHGEPFARPRDDEPSATSQEASWGLQNRRRRAELPTLLLASPQVLIPPLNRINADWDACGRTGHLITNWELDSSSPVPNWS
jgi:hypothetical protein